MLGNLVPVAIVGLFFLQTRGIGQKNFQQVRRPARTIDRPAKTMTNKSWQVASVIDMRMSDDYRINQRGVEGRLLPVAFAQFTHALEQAAVDQHPRAIGFDQILRAGYSARCAPE